MTPYDLIAGCLRLGLASGLLTAAALRWTPLLLPGGPLAASEVFLRVFLVATSSAVASVALLGAFGLLAPWALLAFAVALYAAARTAKALPAPRRRAVVSWRRILVFWPGGLAAVFAALGVAVFLPTSPVNWDAMTYHLYFPARWIQEGRLLHIPTVFSDESSAFAPQNGALFFTWQMALLGRDATTNVSQVACLGFLAVAVYRMALLSGVRRQAAVMAAAGLFWLAPLARWTFTANVDVFMVAFWTGAVYWLRLYLARRDLGSVVACGLASGLAAGTKTLGLPLVAIPAGLLAVHLISERRWARFAALAAAAFGGGGWWYAKNLWLYANPVFPLDLGVAGMRFAGVFTAETLRRESPFHIEQLDAWFRSLGAQLGVATVVVFAAGLLGLPALARTARGQPSRKVAALAAIGFAVAWAWYDFAIVPHNNQARFLLPSFVTAALGWAAGLDAVRSRRLRAGLFLLGSGALAWAWRPDLAWRYALGRLEASGVNALAWVSLAALVATLLVWTWRRMPARPAVLLTGIVLALTVGAAAHHAARSRIAFLADADFRAWAPGYLLLNQPGLEPRRIAYSGLNVPYALSGSASQHEVIYCNVKGAPGDGLYEFWSGDRRLHPTPNPGLYRGDGDFGVWSSCLRGRGIDTVVVFEVIAVERRSHWQLSGGFPIERDWMRRRPASFELILGSDRAEVYKVVELGEAAGSPLVDDAAVHDRGHDLEVLELARR